MRQAVLAVGVPIGTGLAELEYRDKVTTAARGLTPDRHIAVVAAAEQGQLDFRVLLQRVSVERVGLVCVHRLLAQEFFTLVAAEGWLINNPRQIFTVLAVRAAAVMAGLTITLRTTQNRI
jgi:hypothetical protein